MPIRFQLTLGHPETRVERHGPGVLRLVATHYEYRSGTTKAVCIADAALSDVDGAPESACRFSHSKATTGLAAACLRAVADGGPKERSRSLQTRLKSALWDVARRSTIDSKNQWLADMFGVKEPNALRLNQLFEHNNRGQAVQFRAAWEPESIQVYLDKGGKGLAVTDPGQLRALADELEAAFPDSGKSSRMAEKPSLAESHEQAVRRYMGTIVDQCDVVWFPGLTPNQGPELLSVYTDLYTREPSKDLNADDELERIGSGQRVAVLQAAAEQSALVLLGPPGCGKSTFLRYLAVSLARHHRNPKGGAGDALLAKGWPQELLDCVPIWMELSKLKELSAADLKTSGASLLWDTFVSALPDLKIPLLDIVNSGRALFLLDGLDEVTDPSQRDVLKEAVLRHVRKAFADCRKRVILTCRERSWYSGWEIGGWPDAERGGSNVRTISGLSTDEQKAFVKYWFERARVPNSREEADKLVKEIANPVRNRGGRMEQLASSPLTLSMLAWLRTRPENQGHALPVSRAAIYEQAIHALLWHLDDNRRGHAAQSTLPKLIDPKSRVPGFDYPRMTRGEFLSAIAKLAFHAQRDSPYSGLADIPLGHLKEEVARLALPEGRTILSEEEEIWAARVINTVQCRAGLLRESEPGKYRFHHRSFQEYLAGFHLVRQTDFVQQALDWKDQQGKPMAVGSGNESDDRDPVAARESLWEVLLLAVGHLVVKPEYRATPDPDPVRDTTKAQRLIETLIRPGPVKDDPYWVDVWLAGELFEEVNPGQDTPGAGQILKGDVCRALVELVEAGALSPPERAAAGRVLGRLGDPRPGVGAERNAAGKIVPKFEWLPVPPVGSAGKADGKRAEPGFYISRYPVTVDQYTAFVNDGGYSSDKWFQSKQARSWWKGASPRSPKEEDDSRFQTPNHPRVGINFYEAEAYCAWATTVVPLPLPPSVVIEGSAKPKWKICLPTEEQWEWAARGNTQREYSWGDSSDEDLGTRCNCSESLIRSTSAVGTFPSGRAWSDAKDMTGNVWEWTDSRYERQRDYRVLRGGSWVNLPERLRVTYR